MAEFFIDKLGNDELEEDELNNEIWSEDDETESLTNGKQIDLPEVNEFVEDKTLKKKKHSNNGLTLKNTYISCNHKNNEPDSTFISKILQKSVIKPGFEKQNFLPSIKSNRSIRFERKKLMEKTKGDKWFNIPATEVTEEIKNDFEVLKMRAALDKTHVYKNNTITTTPKYFQVGKVLDNPTDFYSHRVVKSQRKKTIVDELLADAECKSYQKKKYKEIMDSNRRRRSSVKKLQKHKQNKKKDKYKK